MGFGNVLTGKVLPESIEAHRDSVWRRADENRVEDVRSAEDFIERVGFCSAMTDCRRVGPSLYVAVCGRRDAHMPRNVQKDPESSLAWTIKDDVMRRGRVYYGKLLRGRSTFIARRLFPHFNAIWGVSPAKESSTLSLDARAVLRVLRKEWEMGSRDLREASGIENRPQFNKAIDELQKSLKVIPVDVVYKPSFSYIWSVVESRFSDELQVKTSRDHALSEIAATYLRGAGMTLRGELARVTGLNRAEVGSANWTLVDLGFARRVTSGIYQWSGID